MFTLVHAKRTFLELCENLNDFFVWMPNIIFKDSKNVSIKGISAKEKNLIVCNKMQNSNKTDPI